VKAFQELNRNPYIEKEVDRFYVNKVDDTNWEDLEYAEENVDLGRDHTGSRKPNVPVADQAHITRQAKRFIDPKDFYPM
jgi:hypothetical protein